MAYGDNQYQDTGYQATRPSIPTWWNQDVSDAGQALYSDPNLAVTAAMIPQILLAEQQAAEQEARESRSGFLGTLVEGIKDVAGVADTALSNVPGWGVAKEGLETAFRPIDKLAQGLYWVYSEAISQPLSTAMLQLAKADLQGYDTLLSGDEWGQAYEEAEHVSPGQAVMNIRQTMAASDEAGITSFLMGGGGLIGGVDTLTGGALTETIFGDITSEQSRAVRRNTERFLYDTDFWRDQSGWKYTVGTGAFDFALTIGADPAYAAIKATTTAVRAARSITTAAPATQRGGGLAGAVGERVGRAISPGPVTPEVASNSAGVNAFFDWAMTPGANGTRRNAAEIAQHPIWGRGRRVNPERDRLSQVFANTARDDMPMLMRFAAGDNEAASILATRSQDTIIQSGRAMDNRALVDSMRFDDDVFRYYMSEEAAGRTSYLNPTEGLGGRSPGVTTTGQIVEPPFPRPTTPGPRQAGWDMTYGHLQQASDLYRQSAREAMQGLQGVRPIAPAVAPSADDIARAETWKANQLDLAEQQIEALQAQSNTFASALGQLGRSVDDFSPGQSNIFGTVKSMYRTGPLAVRSSERAAERNIARLGAGRGDRIARGDAGFATRMFRNGFYTPATRMVTSFGDRIPAGFVTHTDDDAHMRVAEMLKQVPGLGRETRLRLLDTYVRAGDKTSRARVLDSIHTAVIDHMATARSGLDPQTAAMINEMRRSGFSRVMMQLTGQAPTRQRFSAATDSLTGRRVDLVEDGENWVVSPIARTQLEAADPLLPVRELERLLKRNSGFLRTARRGGGLAADNVRAVGDQLNTLWKASTLLRPGYTIRSMSDEQAASAVKFGILSSVANLGEGGANWMRNRVTQIKAFAGQASYAPTTGAQAESVMARLRITDDDAIRAAEARGLPTERIRMNDAWPLVQSGLREERDGLRAAEAELARARAKGESQDILDDLTNQMTDHQNTLDEFKAYAQALLAESRDASGRRMGEGTFEVDGIVIPQAFSRQWDAPIPRDQITSNRAMETIFARREAIGNNRLINTGSWTTISPEDANHMESWLNGLNNQFRQDDLFRLVAQDRSLTAARQWLRTPEGRYHLSTLGPRARDTDGLLHAIRETMDQYLPEGTGLQAKIARGEEVTEAELRAAIHMDDFPLVHGEELKTLTSRYNRQSAQGVVDNMIAKGFERLGTIPNDIMARQPIYLRAQEARMRELVGQEMAYRRSVGRGDAMDMATLNRMLEKSDRLARKDISQVVYDPTRTTATEALRFVTPFLSAHMDGLARWGGLIAERPQFVVSAAKIYNAPVAANMVTDRYGRPVSQDGYVTYENEEGETVREFVGLEDRIITLRMPGQTKNVKGVGEVPAGGIPISMQAINTIMPGDPWFNPGSGPFVQMGASEIARRNPEVGDFLQWAKILPYGPDQSALDAWKPTYMQAMQDTWNAYTTDAGDNEAYQRAYLAEYQKVSAELANLTEAEAKAEARRRATEIVGDGSGNKYQQAYLAEYQRQMAEFHNGGFAPDMDEVAENAKRFMFLDAFASWAMPTQTQATPLTGTPYQFFVDQYKAMQEVNPRDAQERFLARYGADYFAFTASLSESMGIAATISADETAERYSDLIERDPDMAGLIIGDVYNQGEFSSSVYRKQMGDLIAGQRVRTPLTAEEAIRRNQADLGWVQYNQAMHAIDASLIRSGFTSYAQAGAEEFAEVKRDMTQLLGAENEAWYEDFGENQLNRMPMMIDSMRRITADENLMRDPMRSDLRVLSGYLLIRDQLQLQLRSRGFQSLSFDELGNPTGENADIGGTLRTFQTELINMDTRFGDLFHRYLENDDLS